MEPSRGRCQALPRGGTAPRTSRGWGLPAGRQLCGEGPGSAGAQQLPPGRQPAPVAQEAGGALGGMRRSVASRRREVTLPLGSALGRPPRECCAQRWAPQFRRRGAAGEGPAGAAQGVRGLGTSRGRAGWDTCGCSARGREG